MIARIGFALACLLLGSWAPHGLGAGGGGGSAPTITSRSLAGASPAVTNALLTWNGQAAQVDANQTLTSCAITAGNSAGNFACAASGAGINISITATGAANLTGGSTDVPFSLTVTGTNGNGTSAPVTVTVDVYADGSVNAPACGANSINFATLLNSYSTRAPWNVAGVDYCVGVPSGTTLSDPVPSGTLAAGLTSLGCSLASPLITCSGANCNNGDFTSWDFTLHNNFIRFQSCTSPTIEKSKFAYAADNGNALINLQSSVNGATIQYNFMDGQNFGSIGVGMIESNAFGTTNIKYNYMVNAAAEEIVMGGSGSGSATHVVSFNVIRNTRGNRSGFHGDWVQEVTSNQTIASTSYFFDTMFQDITGTSTQGLSIMSAGGVTGGQYDGAAFSYNTFASSSATFNQPNYFMIVDNVWLNGSATISNNYADPTGINSQWLYFGNFNGIGSPPFSGTLSCTNNVNMVTGNKFTGTQSGSVGTCS